MKREIGAGRVAGTSGCIFRKIMMCPVRKKKLSQLFAPRARQSSQIVRNKKFFAINHQEFYCEKNLFSRFQRCDVVLVCPPSLKNFCCTL